MMDKITLPPGVWTLVVVNTAIQSKSNQSGVRIHFGEEEPPVDTDVYFSVPEFDQSPFRIPGLGHLSFSGGENVYMMPEEDQSVDIVTW